MTKKWSTGISKGYVSETCNHHPARSLPSPKVNILIDDYGHARLTGFNQITMASDQSTMTSPTMTDGTIPWMSPELLYPEKFGLEESHLTKESDCYALGIVIYEVLTGQAPFALCRDPEVVYMVLGGERPKRPEGDEGKLFTDEIWEVLERCWKNHSGDRPSAKAVLRGLEGNLSPLRPPSGMDGDSETDTDGQSDGTASRPGMFSPFHSRLTSNCFRDITALPTIHGDNEPLVPSQGSPPGVPSPTIPQDSGRLPDPPQTGGQREGRIIDRLTRSVRKIFKPITRKFLGLRKARQQLVAHPDATARQ